MGLTQVTALELQILQSTKMCVRICVAFGLLSLTLIFSAVGAPSFRLFGNILAGIGGKVGVTKGSKLSSSAVCCVKLHHSMLHPFMKDSHAVT